MTYKSASDISDALLVGGLTYSGIQGKRMAYRKAASSLSRHIPSQTMTAIKAARFLSKYAADNVSELRNLRAEQAGLESRVNEMSSPLYAFKAALGRTSRQ